jgi:hypothetical protein
VHAARVGRPVQVGPASREMRAPGSRPDVGPRSTVRPVRGNAATYAFHRSANATQRPSGDGTICVALSDWKCTTSSPPFRSTLTAAPSSRRGAAQVDALAGVVEHRLRARAVTARRGLPSAGTTKMPGSSAWVGRGVSPPMARNTIQRPSGENDGSRSARARHDVAHAAAVGATTRTRPFAASLHVTNAMRAAVRRERRPNSQPVAARG